MQNYTKHLNDGELQPIKNAQNMTMRAQQRPGLNGLSNQTPQLHKTNNTMQNFKSPSASMHIRGDKRARSIVMNGFTPASTDKKILRSKGGSPGGIYLYESTRFKDSLDDDNNNISIIDFIKKNISNGKQYKNFDFERSKQTVNKIYLNIKRRQDFGVDVNNLNCIQSLLPPKLKYQFMNNSGFSTIFQDTNTINSAFMQIVDQVSCYRMELGLLLQRLVESYNNIILQQFQEFYKNENAKERELKVKLKEQEQITDELKQKKQEFQVKIDQVQAIISSKDAQIQSLLQQEEQQEKEIKYLREMLAHNKNKEDKMAAESDKKLSSNIMSGKRSSSMSNKIENQSAIDDYNVSAQRLKIKQDVIQNFEKEQSEKKNILNGMDRLLKTMLKTTKVSVGTQVEDAYANQKSVKLNEQITSTSQFVQSHLGLSQIESIKMYNQPSQLGDVISNKQIDDHQQQHILSNSQLNQAESKIHYISPMENYANTMKIMSQTDIEKLQELEQKLLAICNQIKYPDAHLLHEAQQLQWQIPPHILTFLQNTLQKDNIQAKIIPWQDFKAQIYDIYDTRIQHSNEILGAINTNFLNLEEYIIIYMLDKHKNRKQAEFKLIELLASLKYYSDVWYRGKVFAQLINIIKFGSINRNENKNQQAQVDKQGLNPSHYGNQLNELQIPGVDIYLQEFFLYMYSIIMQEKDNFLESKDGVTYVKAAYEETSTQILMTWFNEQDSRKWFHKVRRNVKRIKTSPLDDFETDYIDIDVLMLMYIEEFKHRKKVNQKILTKEFIKQYQDSDGNLNTDELDKIMSACIPITSNSVFVKHPSIVSFRRAFLYALVCNENNFNISIQQFIAGCNRFGIDNPSPFVTKRIGLYGNDEDFEDILKKELIKSNINQQSKVHTAKPNKQAIKLESSRISSQFIRAVSIPNNQNQFANAEDKNTSPSKVAPAIQNLKLLGNKTQNLLDANELDDQNQIIASGIKLNIANLGKDILNLNVQQKKQISFSVEEQSINNQKIIIPSFSTTSTLFSQHFGILRDLKKRIEGLKQAYFNQREEDRSWEQVEKILQVLETACRFLDFPIQQ